MSKRAPRFEVYRNAGGEWAWRLKGANGEVVASGEGYTTRGAARRAVRAIIRCAAVATMEDLQ